MKKSYIYFIIPLLGLIVFGGYYWNFTKGYDAHLAQVAQAKQDAIDRKNQEQEEARLKAAKDALAIQAKRKEEAAARKAMEEKRTADLQAAANAKGRALEEVDRQQKWIDRLNRDLDAAHDDITRLKRTKKDDLVEEDFIKGAIVKAETNQQSLADVLQKIKNADDYAAQQAAQAAAAAAAQH